MAVFVNYAHFYDALYQEKDYEAECDFLEQVFARYAQSPIHTILDLGCGTGGHALILAQRGYQVTGIDYSEEMLAIARAKAASTLESSAFPTFQHGDIRTLDLGQTYDAVIAMFAVMGYMVTNEDLAQAFGSVRRHLTPGGLFTFDAWFGPAVLTVRPSDRYKVIEQDNRRIIRFVHPTLDAINHKVDVHYMIYHIFENRIIEEVEEVHTMRFLFPQEVNCYLKNSDFKLIQLCPSLSLSRELELSDWNFAAIAQA